MRDSGQPDSSGERLPSAEPASGRDHWRAAIYILMTSTLAILDVGAVVFDQCAATRLSTLDDARAADAAFAVAR